ncbi:MAG: peptidylprolyl isomerase [Ignavibacteriales bacterium]|nr:peptidylprolyl isomerase [Ignavibacteriales bacterium]
MKYFFAIAFIVCAQLLQAQETIDKVAAIIDNEIIMKSELDFQVNMLIAQRKAKADTPELRKALLENMIDEKLVYAQALIDSITVSEDEVSRQIDYQINVLTQQYGSKEKIEQIYGMSIEKIKRELRENAKKDMLVQRVQEKKFGMLEASRREVEDFFYRFKDSLGVIPEKVKISHIFKNPKTSVELKRKYKMKAQALLDSIKAGADFAELARANSEDPGSAANGGDLGFVKRGVFFPEFEAAAYSLTAKQYAPVVESPVGYHVIQLLERRGESIHTRHILVKVKADDEADLNAIEVLNSIRDSIVKKQGTFAGFAKQYSDDEETAAFGGVLGSFYMEQMDKNLLEITAKMKEGDISFPKRVDYTQGKYGYHIVWLESRIQQHQPDLEIDFPDVKKLADEYKKQRLYKKWMEELKEKIFWEIKI